MIQIGSYNRLEIVRKVDFGVYLSDGESDVLLPIRQVPPKAGQGTILDLFVYTDSEDRPIATTHRPFAVAGEFALMRIVSLSAIGAFADWGIPKDLLIPLSEQRQPLVEGRSYVVRVVLDILTDRVIGSTKLSKYLDPDTSKLKEGQQVEALIIHRMEHSTMAIIDGRFSAAFFPDEIHRPLKVGEKTPAFVKKIREDGKISLSLTPVGYQAVAERAPDIIRMLEKEGGFLPFSDSSSPEEIRKVFGMSKGSFKKLLGKLLKEDRIEISFHGIRLKRR
ncbi:MAG: S1-like domain-containing RNA-binding protein [Fimbriimonas sp.]|nr:S1-like domain-containing RNA-binding protein [Fimbriimonas sp.]